MKRSILLLVMVAAAVVHAVAVPFCRVKRYDEYDGLSERRVKQIAQDRDGILWFATWNGLNRFDGYKFDRIRPHVDDEARAFSDRIGDLKLTADGDLWCRIDDKILLFDVSTYRFHDITSRLENKFNDKFSISQILSTDDGHTVLGCADGRFIVMADSMPVESASITAAKPKFRYFSLGNRKLGDCPPYKHEDLIYSRSDSTGRAWVITRKGDVLSAPSRNEPLEHVASIDERGGTFYYALTDTQGNIWVRSGLGAYCLTIGELPYSTVPQSDESVMRAFYRDAAGRTWVSISDREAVACYAALDKAPKYLDCYGRLHDNFAAFGASVYSIAGDEDGNMWFGCKPGGLFRLTARGDGSFDVDNFKPFGKSGLTDEAPAAEGVYDIEFDSEGRMWIATMGGGVDCVTSPGDEKPKFTHLGAMAGYPSAAKRVRDISIVGDSMALAATTGGVLAFRLPRNGEFEKTAFVLHVTEPGRAESLGNIAAMHVEPDSKGLIFVATESDGVNMLAPGQSALDGKASFRRFNSYAGAPNDVAYALAVDSRNGSVWTLSGNAIYNIDPESGGIISFPSSFWHGDMHFSDARPLRLEDNKWLIGLESGALVIDFDRMTRKKSVSTPLVFTAVSLQNRPDSLISARTDTLVLKPDERNVTIKFSSLSYGAAENIRYSFCVDESGWNDLGNTRAVTFLDLAPGKYSLKVRSTDSSGNRPDSVRELVIVVTPTIWETPLAYCLYVLFALAVAGGILFTITYIRRIKRKQRELLDAYMELMEKSAGNAGSDSETGQLSPPGKLLSEDDEVFMRKVMEFVNDNMGNADAGVDEMAAHTATSRSSLNRKMKSLLGVTPADFIKESRLNRAASLLAESEQSITDIAIECGFSDINYFGKCFKASRKMSPSAYRKNQKENNNQQ